jgi:hypothetical protein
MKVGLRFPLHRMLVEVLKTFQIFLHQLTPEALIKLGVFIWAMRSQGLEQDVRCFCNIHELSYETKATEKEQYYNNFGCYSFMPRSEANYPMPTFQKKWLRSWMKQWFCMKNDLDQREDVRGVIQRPIWSRFGIRRPSIATRNEVQVCQMAFNTICTYIGMRDLVQEHITFKVWPLANEWEMPMEAASGSNQGGLVYIRYTFLYRSQFDEPNDDWLDVIEATSDELLRAYSRTEDEAMTVAFGARGKKRLNKVFDVIGFVYPDYCFPVRKQGGKIKTAASTSSIALKPKRAKVLTHRPKPIGMAQVPKLIESAEAGPLAIETSSIMPIKTSAGPVEEPGPKKTTDEQPKLPSCPNVTELPKLSTTATTTPRKRRMASVLDAVLESMKTPTPASTEASSEKIKDIREVVTASASSIHVEAGPSRAVPIELVEESLPEKPSTCFGKAAISRSNCQSATSC